MTFIDSFDAKFSSLTSPLTRTASYNTGPTLLSNNTAPTLRPTTLRQHCCPAILRHTTPRQHCFPQHCAKTAFYSTAQSLLSNNTAPTLLSNNTAPTLLIKILRQHCFLQHYIITIQRQNFFLQQCTSTALYEGFKIYLRVR